MSTKKRDYIDKHKVSRVELSLPQEGTMDPDADVVDIVVHMEDGSRHCGTVTTLEYIKQTMERARGEGADAEGDYWFGDAIIMQRIDESKLARIVEDLIDSFMFEKAFRKTDVCTVA